jgi:hypothetical protein
MPVLLIGISAGHTNSKIKNLEISPLELRDQSSYVIKAILGSLILRKPTSRSGNK